MTAPTETRTPSSDPTRSRADVSTTRNRRQDFSRRLPRAQRDLSSVPARTPRPQRGRRVPAPFTSSAHLARRSFGGLARATWNSSSAGQELDGEELNPEELGGEEKGLVETWRKPGGNLAEKRGARWKTEDCGVRNQTGDTGVITIHGYRGVPERAGGTHGAWAMSGGRA